MIGDSWGVPNYAIDAWPTTPPEIHTEYRLKNLGYDVLNFCLNGGSMLETIEYARYTLSGISLDTNVWLNAAVKNKRNLYPTKNSKFHEMPIPDFHGQKIDWIVWFHTEALRDSHDKTNLLLKHTSLYEMHEVCSKAAYQAFASLVELIGPHVKTAIIGGQAPVDKLLYNYHKPTFIIEDWKKELLGFELPLVYTFSNVEWVEQSLLPTEEKLKILDNHRIVLDALCGHPHLFFDNCHPGSRPHEELTQKLHALFKSY